MVKRTRAISEDALYAASRARMSRLIANGVTTVESKSGAGLDKDVELRLMRVSRALGKDLPITVISTFLGAHGLAPEFAGRRDDYVDFMCNEVLPEAVKQDLVDQVDGFCDKVGFSHEQMGRLFGKAQSYGLGVKAHSDQYTDFGAGAMVARASRPVGRPPRIRLARHGSRDGGSGHGGDAAARRASDPARDSQAARRDVPRDGRADGAGDQLNPVSSPTVSPAAQMHLACYLFRLTPDEALRGFTVNSAKALELADSAGPHRRGPSRRSRCLGHRRSARHRLRDRRGRVPRRGQERRRGAQGRRPEFGRA